MLVFLTPQMHCAVRWHDLLDNTRGCLPQLMALVIAIGDQDERRGRVEGGS
jgi:hypothetical protein